VGRITPKIVPVPASDRQRIVVTGIGVVSPNGIGAAAFDLACRAGKSGISSLHGIETAGLRTSAVGIASNFESTDSLDSVDARRLPRMVALALAASREAIQSSGLQIDPENLDLQRDIGVVLGTGGGGLAFVEEQYRSFYTLGKASLFSITGGTHGNLSSELSIALHLRGPSHVISTGCASSTDAIGYARMMIRSGVARATVCGGADAPVAPGILTAFEKMRVVSTRRWDRPEQSSRPFDAQRDGFVLGEGAWMFVLEDLEHARSRNATVLAEIAGYGCTCDAYHRVQIAPDVIEPVRAIENALADASLGKDGIGYVNLHGTSTELNDRMETAAIRKCFGSLADKIPMSSTKSMIGHPQGAGGAAGVAATILALRAGHLHPTINLENPDPQCDLDYIPQSSRPTSAKAALCNCIAFGSKNSALVVTV
jgi:3-oxoacyl-[acyl-carrier-protein] synthase II